MICPIYFVLSSIAIFIIVIIITLSGKMVHESGGIIVGKSLEAHSHHSGVLVMIVRVMVMMMMMMVMMRGIMREMVMVIMMVMKMVMRVMMMMMVIGGKNKLKTVVVASNSQTSSLPPLPLKENSGEMKHWHGNVKET